MIAITTVSHITSEEIVEPPAKHTICHLSSISNWLISICSNIKPTKNIMVYEIGLFESATETLLYIVGKNVISEINKTLVQIDFEPKNMYLKLDAENYNNKNGMDLLLLIELELKAFIATPTFYTSFLSLCNVIIIKDNGCIIWQKP